MDAPRHAYLKDRTYRIGVRDFDERSEAERNALLGSPMRQKAFDSLDTVTPFRAVQREQKKNTALELIARVVTPELLKSHPLVYIGSGSDVEYPLVLGARDIVLIDPVFRSPDAAGTIAARVEQLTSVQPHIEENTISFEFEFEQGKPEPVCVTLIPESYPVHEAETERVLPPDAGYIVLFASKSIDTVVRPDEYMLQRLAPGGAIIDGPDVVTRDPETGGMHREQLGRMRPGR